MTGRTLSFESSDSLPSPEGEPCDVVCLFKRGDEEVYIGSVGDGVFCMDVLARRNTPSKIDTFGEEDARYIRCVVSTVYRMYNHVPAATHRFE